MKTNHLTKNTLLEYAKYYYNGIQTELSDDIKKYKFINRFLIRLSKNKPININLFCNHLICLYNVFEFKYINYLLFISVENDNLKYLKTTLMYLGIIDKNCLLYKNIPISYELDLLLSQKVK